MTTGDVFRWPNDDYDTARAQAQHCLSNAAASKRALKDARMVPHETRQLAAAIAIDLTTAVVTALFSLEEAVRRCHR